MSGNIARVNLHVQSVWKSHVNAHIESCSLLSDVHFGTDSDFDIFICQQFWDQELSFFEHMSLVEQDIRLEIIKIFRLNSRMLCTIQIESLLQ